MLAVVLAFCALASVGAQAAAPPVLRANAQTLSWTPSGKYRVYRVLASAPRATWSKLVVGRVYKPPLRPGRTVQYRVKAAYGGSAWSNRVAISYPSRGEPPPPPEGGGGSGEGPPPPPPPPEEEGVEPPPPGPTGPLTVALDAGGFGPGAFGDVAGAVRAVRLQSRFATDAEVGGAAAAGVRVACWLMGTGGAIGALDPATYAAQVVALFKRYGRGGSFWQGRPDLGGQAIEVLNEPGGSWFWSDPSNYQGYVNLLRVVHETLAASFPEATRPRVLASWDGGRAGNLAFGEHIQALGALNYVDGVTVHPYGGSGGQYGGALGARSEVEAAHQLAGKPVYVTEVGWPTAAGQPATGDSQQWSEQQQAENIKSFIAWARASGYVQMVVIFNYVDYGTNTWYGIEHANRTHKPSYKALGEA